MREIIPDTADAIDAGRRDALDAVLRSTGTPWGSSRWGEFSRCEVGHDLRYGTRHLPVLQQRRAVTDDEIADETDAERNKRIGMQVGSLVHACLGWLSEAELPSYVGPERDWREVWRHAQQQTQERDGELWPVWDPEAVTKCYQLVTGYFLQWGGPDTWARAGYDVVAVEQMFSGRITPDSPIAYSGCADRILRERATSLFVIADQKTRKASPSSRDPLGALADETRVRPQFHGLSWHVRQHYGLDYLPDVINDCIVKTKLPQFYRVRVKLHPKSADMWYRSQVQLAERFTALAEGRAEPRPNLEECIGKFGKCWAYDHCHKE